MVVVDSQLLLYLYEVAPSAIVVKQPRSRASHNVAILSGNRSVRMIVLICIAGFMEYW